MTKFLINLINLIFKRVSNYLCCHGNDRNLTFNLINVMSYDYIFCPCQILALYHRRIVNNTPMSRDES